MNRNYELNEIQIRSECNRYLNLNSKTISISIHFFMKMFAVELWRGVGSYAVVASSLSTYVALFVLHCIEFVYNCSIISIEYHYFVVVGSAFVHRTPHKLKHSPKKIKTKLCCLSLLSFLILLSYTHTAKSELFIHTFSIS